MLSVAIATCTLPANVKELPDVDVDDTGYTDTSKFATSSSCGPLIQNFTLLFSDDAVSSKLFDILPSSASIVSAERSEASADAATLTHANKTMQQNCAIRAHPADNSEQNELFRANDHTTPTKTTE